MANPRALFWRLAHRRYQARKPSLLFEMAAFGWALFFLLVYGGALVADFSYGRQFTLPGMVAVGVPLALGIMHRRIRLERAKGADALYRKRLVTHR